MKIVYIAHPLRGSNPNADTVAHNMVQIDAICRRIFKEHPEILPLSPLHAFGFVDALGPQEAVLEQCRRLLSLAHELWVYGDYESSKGCLMEIECARSLGKTILFEGAQEMDCRPTFRKAGMMNVREKTLRLVQEERDRQNGKWGVQNHEMPVWMLILGEEVGELSEAILESSLQGAHPERGGYDAVLREAVQVAAVSMQIVEFLLHHKPAQRDS